MNKMKALIASITAIATLSAGMIGMNVSADVIDTPNAENLSITYIEGEARAGYSYSFSKVTTTDTLDYGFSIATDRTVTFSFSNCSVGAASVRIYKYGSSSSVGGFMMPASYVPTQYVSLNLTAGNYYITVTPYTGYQTTTGSFYATNISGAIET